MLKNLHTVLTINKLRDFTHLSINHLHVLATEGVGSLSTLIKIYAKQKKLKMSRTLTTVTSDGEFLFIQIKLCKIFSYTGIIGNLYRSPSSRNTDNFRSIIDNTLRKRISHKTKQILIVGDLNIDLINYETDDNSRELVDTTSNHGFT